jgi:hypothetical protein
MPIESEKARKLDFQTLLKEFSEQKLGNMKIHVLIFSDVNLHSINVFVSFERNIIV